MKNRILRKPEVTKLVGLSHVTIWRMEKKGDFPKRVQLGSKSVGWHEADVYEWIASRAVVNA